MTRTVDLRGLSAIFQKHLDNARAAAEAVANVQNAFTQAYGEREMRYQSTIGDLVDEVLAAGDGAGKELYAPIQRQLAEERRALEERQRELRRELLPQAQEEADTLIERSQAARTRHHKTNVELRKREAELEGEIDRLEAKLAVLNAEIKEQGRILGPFIHFRAVRKLTKRRDAVLTDLEEAHQALRDTRQGWRETRAAFEEEQARFREQVQEALLHRSRLQAELDYLEDEEQRELLAHQRAARHVLDELREPITGPNPALQAKVNDLVTLNVERDRYLEGLEKAAHVLGLLSGLAKGQRAFLASLQQLIQQQKEYSQYLPPLRITLPNAPSAVDALYTRLRQLSQTLADTERFRSDPAAFTAHAQAFIDAAGDEEIQWLFEAMGNEIDRATKTQWR
jgi:chromosome segregation ATPase